MRRLGEERGATAVFVAVLLIVLFGFGAMVIDVGNLYWERRQLQNAADAAALSMVIDCALGDCGEDAEQTARQIAVENNVRGAWLEDIDLSVPGEVTVIAHTGDLDGNQSTVLNFLAPVLSDAFRESIVRARSTAVWEQANLMDANLEIPVSGSPCDFMGDHADWPVTPQDLDDRANGLPTVMQLDRDEDGNVIGGDVISLHRPNSNEDLEDGCTVDPGFSTQGGEGAGDPDTMPAGFGFLEDDGDCGVKTLNDPVPDGYEGTFWAKQNPGTSPVASACIKDRVGTAVTIPIFVMVDRDDKKYLLYAPAAFYITGARVSGGGPPAQPPGFQCPGGPQEWCIKGHWVKKVQGGGTGGGGVSFGVVNVRLTQ